MCKDKLLVTYNHFQIYPDLESFPQRRSHYHKLCGQLYSSKVHLTVYISVAPPFLAPAPSPASAPAPLLAAAPDYTTPSPGRFVRGLFFAISVLLVFLHSTIQHARHIPLWWD